MKQIADFTFIYSLNFNRTLKESDVLHKVSQYPGNKYSKMLWICGYYISPLLLPILLFTAVINGPCSIELFFFIVLQNNGCIGDCAAVGRVSGMKRQPGTHRKRHKLDFTISASLIIIQSALISALYATQGVVPSLSPMVPAII